MRQLAHFAEFGGPVGASIQSAIRMNALGSEALVARYLRSCTTVLDVMERMPDVLDGSNVELTGSLITDGFWYWREDLAYYVEKYHVDLGSEFISDVTRRGFVPVHLNDAEARRATIEVIEDWQKGGV